MERNPTYEEFETDEEGALSALPSRRRNRRRENIAAVILFALSGIGAVLVLAILVSKFQYYILSTPIGTQHQIDIFPPVSIDGLANSSIASNLMPNVTISKIFAGDGKIFPKRNSFVYVHYTGTLRNGTVFDSSRMQGRAFCFMLSKESGVIPGYLQGLRQMSLGEHAVLHVPSRLAYGDKGHGGIPPGADLDFDVQLLAVNQHVWDWLNISSIVKPGDGINFPSVGDLVYINFIGYLASTSHKFEDTTARGQPFRFAVGMDQLDFGMDFGIQKLSLGERAVLNIPQEFGYADKGIGPIPPKADLIYDVELLAIQRRNPTCFDECAPPPLPGPATLPLHNLSVQSGDMVDDESV